MQRQVVLLVVGLGAVVAPLEAEMGGPIARPLPMTWEEWPTAAQQAYRVGRFEAVREQLQPPMQVGNRSQARAMLASLEAAWLVGHLDASLVERAAALGPLAEAVEASPSELQQVRIFLALLQRERGLFDRAREAGAWEDTPHLPSQDRLTLRAHLEQAFVAAAVGPYATARAIVQQGDALPPEWSDLEGTYQVLRARLHLWEGEFEAALSRVQRAIDARAFLGLDHPQVVSLRAERGRILMRAGKVAAAVDTLHSMSVLLHAALGPEHPVVLRARFHLGEAYQMAGQFTEARDLYTRIAPACSLRLGTQHPLYGDIHDRWGDVVRRLGDVDAAVAHYQTGLTVRRQCFGDMHHLVGRSWMGLTVAGFFRRDWAVARQRIQHCEAAWSADPGPDRDRAGGRLNNLAMTFMAFGELEKAADYAARARVQWVSVLGEDHLRVAHLENTLGHIHRDLGHLEQAMGHFDAATRIRADVLPELHPDVFENHRDAAYVALAMEDVERAQDLAWKAESGARQHLRLTAATMPEREMLQYARSRARGSSVLVSLALQRPNEQRNRLAWDAVCRARAFVLDELAYRQRSLFDDADSETREIMANLQQARDEVARLLLQEVDRNRADEHRRQFDTSLRQRESAEVAAAKQSMAFRRSLQRYEVGIDAVLRGLVAAPSGDTTVSPNLVAYWKYRHTHLGKEGSSETTYVAFIGNEQDVRLVSLGPAVVIDSLVTQWRNAVGQRPRGLRASASEAEARTWGVALRTRIWDPLTSHLQADRPVLVVPDGLLQLVNLVALPLGDRPAEHIGSAPGPRYLVEAGWNIHVLSAERDVLAFDGQARQPGPVLALGDLDFGEGERVTSRALQKGSFGPLAATAGEVQEVCARVQEAQRSCTILRGPLADERTLRQRIGGNEVVHLATHAFFSTPDSETGEKQSLLTVSGIALSHANQRAGASQASADGVLTAEEISGLDLSSTRWAVLSACDTGVGAVQDGEGVFGLRRAFQVAGAQTIIMSLWQVDDVATRRWMSELYESRYSQGLSTRAAVWRATRQTLALRRERGQSTHPFYWAGFLAVGDWH